VRVVLVFKREFIYDLLALLVSIIPFIDLKLSLFLLKLESLTQVLVFLFKKHFFIFKIRNSILEGLNFIKRILRFLLVLGNFSGLISGFNLKSFILLL